MSKWIFAITWVWMIIVGALLITPAGPVCIACGAPVNLYVGVITILLGLVGIGMAWKKMKKMPAEKPAEKPAAK